MGFLPPATIEQIAAANDIVEVIGGYFPLKRMGGLYKALCPFHQERTPSFTVNPHRQIFKCFGCGAGGSVFRFVMSYENLEFPAAAKKLAERAGIRIVEEELTAADQERVSRRRRLLALHAEAAEFFHHQLLRKPAAARARDYLKSRGIGTEIAKSWKLGYAPESWDEMRDLARQTGFQDEELIESGLVKTPEDAAGGGASGRFYDRFRDRVMFPICNDTGEVIAFSGRVLDAEAKAAKYVNSPETMLFTKGAVLFGLHRSKRALIDRGSAIVCEGQLDLITAFESGVQNVIAPQGTAFTERQAHILKRYVEEVVLCFDADAAGEKAAERSLTPLLAENLTVRVVEMPAGADPDSLIREQGAAAFTERVGAAKDYFDYQLDRESTRPEFGSARGRVAAARRIAAAASLITDPVLRASIANRAATRLELSPQEFRRLLTRSAPSRGEAAPTDPATDLDPALRLLCQVALRDETARAWLLEEPWGEVLEHEPGADLLKKILGAELNLEHPPSIQAFLTTLDATEEAQISGFLEDKPPTHPMAIAHDAWRELECRRVRRRLETRQARLRGEGLEFAEVMKLQKEVLDLQTHLSNISRPLSPPL